MRRQREARANPLASTDLPKAGRLMVLHRDRIAPHPWKPFVKRNHHGRPVYGCENCNRNRSYPAHDSDLAS